MDRELLCSWLDLPPSPWPPDYYQLLGLGRETATAEQIEHRVLERMDLLRRYQLLHPEQATEGMNLLAQAMITLTDPKSRAAYDRRGAAEEPVEPERLPPIVLPEADEKPEVYSLREEEAEKPQSRKAKPAEPRPIRRRPKPATPTPAVLPRPESRRSLYRDLVRIRRVLRPWSQLRSHLDSPEKAFARRTDIIDFMASLTELRPLLPTVNDLIGGSQQPGNLIATMAKQPLAVDVFRSLLPSQREALSKDCRSAHLVLRDAYDERREKIRQLTAKSLPRRILYPVYREIVLRPEWVILAIGVLALVIAFVRSVPS